MSLCCFGSSRTGENHSISNEGFFVITTVFNPSQYQSRYHLYHRFAAHMRETGAQLITVECIFPSLGQNTFYVTTADNPNHIQLKSDSVYWMKESLIKIAASRLPPHAKWICWLDADIEFTDPNWVNRTITALKSHAIVQMFDKAQFLGPPPRNEVLRTDYSFGYSVVKGKVIDQARYAEWYPHPGYGWATTVVIFKLIGGVPDYDIVGSGDLHFAFSLLGRVSNALEQELNSGYKMYILACSQRLHDVVAHISNVELKKPIGYVPVTIRHHWHGSRKNRQYVNRWKILMAHNFNYEADTRRNHAGLLEFVGNARDALQNDILQHFSMRDEDGVTVEPEDLNVMAGVLEHRKKKDQAPKAPAPAPFVGKPKHTKSPFGKTWDWDPRYKKSGQASGQQGFMDTYMLNTALSATGTNQDYHYDHHYDHGNETEQGMGGHHQQELPCASEGGGPGQYSNDYGGAISCTSYY